MNCCATQAASDTAVLRSPDHFVSEPADIRLRDEELRAASRPLGTGLMQTVFVVPDMHCAACISMIESSLNALPQVENARANLTTRRVTVVWDKIRGSGVELECSLNAAGFSNFVQGADAGDAGDRLLTENGRQLLLSLAVAGFAAANIMLLSVSVWSGADAETAQLFHLISGMIAVPAVAFSGRPFFSSAMRALSAGRFNMDVPISLAVLLALGMGLYESMTGGGEAYFDACVTLLFFLLIGRYLDHLMRERARGAVASLVRLTAKGGVLIEPNGQLHYIPQGEIETGMRLRVMPGERFPVDAEIVSGTSDIDRSLVTGESDSVQARTGDRLEAGVLNLTGAVDVIATSDASNSFLAEVLKLMEAAQSGRARYVRVAARMASIYAPAVHLLAFITFIGWMLVSGGDWKASLYTAIAVLIVTCPCALGLAVPVVHVIGAMRLFKQGILMRDGSAFERLAEIDTVAFDKTGTLTSKATHIAAIIDLRKDDEPLVRTLAAHSSHPAAMAIANHLGKTLPAIRLGDIREVPGFGIKANYRGRKVRLGRPQWVGEISRNAAQADPQVTTAFAVEGAATAGFTLASDLAGDAAAAVDSLKRSGLALEILSGDRPGAVRSVVEQLGIDAWSAEMTPAGKTHHLDAMREAGHKTAMVGDGLNDAPALAAAHVSFAPASASEAGRLAADIVYTRGSLLAVPFAYAIAKRTKVLVRQNFGLAIAYNCVAVPLAVAGLVTPLVAAIAMSASSIVVVANSMRLSSGGREFADELAGDGQTGSTPLAWTLEAKA